MNLDILPQLIASGLSVGSLYAIMAVGFVLIFKTTHIVNFSHGDIAMFSAFVALLGLTSWGIPYWQAFLIAIVVGFVLGLVANTLLRPAISRGANVFTLMIGTLGISLMLNALAGNFFGYQTVSFPRAIIGPPLRIFDIAITRHSIVVFIVGGILAIGLYLMLKHTRLGTAMRAMARNSRAAQLMGISIASVAMLAWGIGSAMGAVAGVLVAPVVFLDLTRMILVMIKGFAAAVLGGFTSLPGAFIGGLLVGVFENLIGFYISSQFQTTFVFLLIVIILAIKPTGLLGAPVAGGRT
mgnify:CR=1 FL=1